MYQKTLEALAGRPLVIRTLDIGGDKAHPALGLEKEDNPFLGYRAVRVSLDQPRLFKPQLRAILRAAASGGVELMFPMLASLDEFRRARLLLDECRAELSAEGARQGNPPVGIMVETPAAAMLAREFAAEADFFSVGTNDLTQYTLAADRGNRKLAGLYNPLHPAVVRLSALTCEAALDRGIPAGICGEIAGDTQAIPLLVGLGMTKFSVPAARIPEVKERIRGLDREKCRNLARRALTLATTGEVAALLAEAVY
jgi:phosphotransferase system enzyme I (PtsI)